MSLRNRNTALIFFGKKSKGNKILDIALIVKITIS